MLTGIASRTLPKEENSKKVRTKHCLQSHWKNNGQKYSRNICNIFSRPRWEPLAPKDLCADASQSKLFNISMSAAVFRSEA